MAMGPSISRTILARETSLGDTLKKYPPPFPFLLSRMPAFFSSSNMFSRNFRGIRFFLEISAIRMGSLSFFSAIYIKALKAYWAFLDSMYFLFKHVKYSRPRDRDYKGVR